MRRKRKQYSWFPVLGEEPVDGLLPDGDFLSIQCDELGVTPGDPAPLVVIGLTWDYPTEVEEGFDTLPSLADFQGSEYQLERIVGKFFARLNTNANQTTFQIGDTALVAAGFIVLKVDEKTGAPLRSTDLNEYSPLISENISDPWIWRRVWVLSTQQVIQGTDNGSTVATPFGFPMSTAGYGDLESGPHIDARSVRRVRKEERVFLVVQAMQLGDKLCPQVPLAEGGHSSQIEFLLDYRMLGRLVKASARGNTSR